MLSLPRAFAVLAGLLSFTQQLFGGRSLRALSLEPRYTAILETAAGSDPEQRQARNNNGSKFTVLSVATRWLWKNTDDEWASKTAWHRVCVFRPRLAEYLATTIKKGSHVLVEGSLVSTTYERGNGKGKKAKSNKQTFWCIRADVVRKLDRGEPEPETIASGSATSNEALDASEAAPF